MDGIEEKLGAIMGDPAMMQKIFAMAQSLGAAQNTAAPTGPPQTNPPPPPAEHPIPMPDPGFLQQLMKMAGSTNIDKNQRALLSALSPYLSRERIRKLEQAMRAAKMAGFAVKAVSQQPSGR